MNQPAQPYLVSIADPARPLTTFGLALRQGSLADPPGLAGRASLTAQLMLRGTAKRSRRALSEAIDGLGASCDFSVGRDHTFLWGDMLTRQREPLLALLDEVFEGATFPDDELGRLKRETLAELEAVRDDDASLGMRFFVRALFGDHPYGRPLKGTPRSLARLTREDLLACRASWSQAGAVIGISGPPDFDGDAALASRLTAHLGAHAAWEPSIPTLGRSAGGWRVTLVDKPDRSQTQVFMGHNLFDGAGVHHPDWTALTVAQTPFGGTFTSRLSHEIREKRGWSYGAWGQVSGDARLGTFMMRFAPAAADTVPAIQLAADLLKEYSTVGPTEAEHTAAQKYLQNSFVFTIDTPTRRLSEDVSARLMGHPPDWVDETVARTAAVRHADAVRAATCYLDADALAIAVVGTARDLEPALAKDPRVRELTVVDWNTSLDDLS